MACEPARAIQRAGSLGRLPGENVKQRSDERHRRQAREPLDGSRIGAWLTDSLDAKAGGCHAVQICGERATEVRNAKLRPASALLFGRRSEGPLFDKADGCEIPGLFDGHRASVVAVHELAVGRREAWVQDRVLQETARPQYTPYFAQSTVIVGDVHQ